MSDFTPSVSRGGLRKPRENSRLDSPREPNSSSHLWKDVEKLARRVDSQTKTIAQLRAQVALLEGQKPAFSGLYPFKIYTFPRRLRKFKNNDDWKRVKVRGAQVVLDGDKDSEAADGDGSILYAYGSDGCIPDLFAGVTDDIYLGSFQSLPSSSATIVPGLSGYNFGGWNEAIVDADNGTYFWFSFTVEQDPDVMTHVNYGLCCGSDPSSATFLATGLEFSDTWSGFPRIPDPYHIPIGYVTISDGRIQIQQWRQGNIDWRNVYAARNTIGAVPDIYQYTTPPRDRGLYADSVDYFVGDRVWTIEISHSGLGFKCEYIYIPTYTSDGYGAYLPQILLAPMSGVVPKDTPEAWVQVSRSPYQDIAGNPDWHSGAYDSGKDYLRSA